eukprot:6956991-Karenia_brevis.AAC.1
MAPHAATAHPSHKIEMAALKLITSNLDQAATGQLCHHQTKMWLATGPLCHHQAKMWLATGPLAGLSMTMMTMAAPLPPCIGPGGQGPRKDRADIPCRNDRPTTVGHRHRWPTTDDHRRQDHHHSATHAMSTQRTGHHAEMAALKLIHGHLPVAILVQQAPPAQTMFGSTVSEMALLKLIH